MPCPRRPLLSLLLLALVAGTSMAALAGPQQGSRKPSRADAQDQQQPAARDGRANNNHRDNEDALSDSIRRVERQTRGQVLSAERVPYDGRSLNRIKIVDARGRVRVYMDDPGQQSDPGQPDSRRPGRRPPPPTHSDDD